MSATIDKERGEPPDVGAELDQLRSRETELEQRTQRLELSNPLALFVGFAALALAIGALVVALVDHSDSSSMMNGNIANVPAMGVAGTMMNSSGKGAFTAAQVAAASSGTVYVNLGDYWVQPAVTSVRAGKVSFVAKNMGRVPHELMVERSPIKMDAPGQPNEDAAQAMIDDMRMGESGRTTVQLTPGTYVLFCNVTGHYAAGQHTTLSVTGN
jgi:uncharacterized cupredoxin-like copper-binding protein